MKYEQPALHREWIKKGLMTEEESKRKVAEAQKRDNLEEESREDRYPYGD